MSCNRETISSRPTVSATDPDVVPRPQVVDPGVAAQEVLDDPDVVPQAVVPGVVDQRLPNAPDVVPQPHEIVVPELLDDPDVVPRPQVVAVPEERDFSLEVLVIMAIAVFAYIATAMSHPFESLSFKYRLGSWAVVFLGLWVLLLIWWHRNNGDRRLLNRALRQIRGTGGL
jgi:hypothetical protein